MATIREIEAAIRAADKAGRKADVQRLAAERSKLLSGEAPVVLPGTAIEADQSNYHYMTPEQYQQRPFYEQAPIALEDTLRLLSNGVTFGMRDKFAEYLGGGTPEQERMKTEMAKQRAGFPGDLAEATGMSMVPGGPLAQIERQGLAPGLNWLQRLAAGGAVASGEGGIAGGLNAYGHDEDVMGGVQQGMLLGPLARGAAGAASRGIQAGARAFTKKPPRLSKNDLPIVDTGTTGRHSIRTSQGGNKFISGEEAADIASRAGRFDDWARTTAKVDRKVAKSKGATFDDKLRDESESIIERMEKGGKRKPPYNEKDKEALDEMVRGTTGRNVLSKMSMLAPSSNIMYSGLGGSLGGALAYGLNLGPTAGAAAIAALPAIGMLAKAGSNKVGRKVAKDFSDRIIRGSEAPPVTTGIGDTAKASEKDWEKFLRSWWLTQKQHKPH